MLVKHLKFKREKNTFGKYVDTGLPPFKVIKKTLQGWNNKTASVFTFF